LLKFKVNLFVVHHSLLTFCRVTQEGTDSDLQDENAYEALKYWRDMLGFLLEDAGEAFVQYFFVDKYVLETNWFVTINSVIMFVMALVTLIRFLVYVIRYWKIIDDNSDKLMLVFMTSIIFSIFTGSDRKRKYPEGYESSFFQK
jgi:hypothetical protein